MGYLTNITSDVQTQINSIQAPFKLTGSTITYINNQYDVLFLYSSIPDGVYDMDVYNTTTHNITSFKLVKFNGMTATITNIITESLMSIYAYANTCIACSNDQSGDRTLNWSIVKKI
jgi:hypothetical protein